MCGSQQPGYKQESMISGGVEGYLALRLCWMNDWANSSPYCSQLVTPTLVLVSLRM